MPGYCSIRLRSWIVVDGDAVDEVLCADRRQRTVIGEAQIRVVDADGIGAGVPGHLQESAEIVGDLAGIEEAQSLGKLQRVPLSLLASDTGVRKRLRNRGVRGLELQADGRQLAQRQGSLAPLIDVLNLLHVAEDVAVHLEQTT